MYNPRLDTFMIVADAGSFTKAAKKLFITPSAVLQQINLLESELGVSLFDRSTKGIKLTLAGEYLHNQAPHIISWNTAVRNQLKILEQSESKTLRVAVPKMHKMHCFYELWTKYSQLHPEMNVEFVEAKDASIEETSATYSAADITEFINLPILRQENQGFLKLCDANVVLGITQKNPLYGKENISVNELAGHKVYVNKASMYDSVVGECEILEKAGAELVFCEDYGMPMLERCVMNGDTMLLFECSKYVHPRIMTARLDWESKRPYGFFYSPAADNGPDSFIEFVREQIRTGEFTMNVH